MPFASHFFLKNDNTLRHGVYLLRRDDQGNVELMGI